MKVFGKLRTGASIRVMHNGKQLLELKVLCLRSGVTLGLDGHPSLEYHAQRAPPAPGPPRGPRKPKPA